MSVSVLFSPSVCLDFRYTLSGFLLGGSCSLCILTYCSSLVISHFGFEGWTLVLMASVPGHCLSFTLICSYVQRCRDQDV